MSHEMFRNRQALGSIPQIPVGPVIISSLTKNLTFDVSTDLTSNFVQTMGSGATETVTGGVVQFRNTTWDINNYITTNFTMKFINSFFQRVSCNATSSATNYHITGQNCKVVDASGAAIKDFSLVMDFAYLYSESSYGYWNSGYMYWQLTDSTMTQAAAIANRLCAAPSRGAYHTYELIDLKNGYVQFKLDGVVQGSNMWLGNATYRLGGPFQINYMGGWYNSYITGDLDTLIFDYNV